MNQLATFVEALGISAALENGTCAHKYIADQLFALVQAIGNNPTQAHEVIQTIS